jgi:hypothetical protein
MAFPAVNTYVDGDAMIWTQHASDFTAVRDWLNDLALADVSDGAIEREHLARPTLTGFPVQGIESTVQASFWRTFGLEDPDAMTRDQWGVRPHRLTVFPSNLPEDNTWRFPIGGTFRIPAGSHLQIWVGLEWQVRGPASGVGFPIYPNPGGTPGVTGGYFTLIRVDRATGAETVLAESQLPVYPQENTAGTETDYHDSGRLHATVTSAVDAVVDIILAYRLDLASTTIQQIDIGNVHLVHDVH